MAELASRQRESERVCVGVVTGAHGLKGLVRIKPFTEAPEAVAAYGPVETEDGGRRLRLEVTNRTGKGQVIVRVAGVEDREAAELLQGERLYVRRRQLPAPGEDEYYHADLIGLLATRRDGTPVGEIRAVYDFGAGDVLEVVDRDGASLMVPFTRAGVPEIDLAAGRVVVDDAYLVGPEEEAERDERQS